MKISKEILHWSPPDTFCSASVLVSGAQCLRLGLINGFYNPGGSTIHTEFGSALGEAAGCVAEYWEEGYDVYMWNALEACLKFDVTLSEGNKDWRSLWRALLMFKELWAHQYSQGWRFVTAEQARKITVVRPDGTTYHIAGAQDLTLRNEHSGRYKVVDLKAVKTSYFYSWNHDIQVLVYNILDDLLDPEPDRQYARPEFWVYETAGGVDSVDQFTVHVLEGSVIKTLIRSIPGLASTLCAEADKLKAIGTSLEAIPQLEDTFDTLPANHKLCKSGNFRCFKYATCHDDTPLRPGGRTVYQQAAELSLTAEELTVAVDSLYSRIVDDYEAGGVSDALNVGYGITIQDAELTDALLAGQIPARTNKLFD